MFNENGGNLFLAQDTFSSSLEAAKAEPKIFKNFSATDSLNDSIVISYLSCTYFLTPREGRILYETFGIIQLSIQSSQNGIQRVAFVFSFRLIIRDLRLIRKIREGSFSLLPPLFAYAWKMFYGVFFKILSLFRNLILTLFIQLSCISNINKYCLINIYCQNRFFGRKKRQYIHAHKKGIQWIIYNLPSLFSILIQAFSYYTTSHILFM